MLNRALAVLQSGSNLENFVQYEFVNYVPSLFDNFSMRKTVKSALAQYLELDKHIITENVSPPVTIIDGGHLLHVVVWLTPLTYKGVVDLYTKYIISHYSQGRIIVVFDGYGDKQTTKSLEQCSRAMVKTSVDINLMLDAQTTSQKEFLNNSHKTALISELTKALLSRGVEVNQAAADADLDIVLSAMAAAEGTSGPIHVVSRDTDVLVFLLGRLHSEEVILVQPQPGNPSKLISIQQVKACLGSDLCDVLLPLHAMTGCSTTSAPFGIGKEKPLILAKHSDERDGENLMFMMYNVKKFKNLDKARYFRLKQMIARTGLSSKHSFSNKQFCKDALLPRVPASPVLVW